MRNKRILAIFVVLTALSACGQKGPLRLESGQSEKNSQMEASSNKKANSPQELSSEASETKDQQIDNDLKENGKGGKL